MATVSALMGPPGSGKTQMATLTAPRKPVHVVDIDRKIRSLARLQEAIKNGELTFKEIGETLSEDALKGRLDALIEDKKGLRPPKGWSNFANYIGTFESDEVVKKAVAAGLIEKPGEEVCVKCHNEESPTFDKSKFNYKEMAEKIKHGEKLKNKKKAKSKKPRR